MQLTDCNIRSRSKSKNSFEALANNTKLQELREELTNRFDKCKLREQTINTLRLQ